MASGVGTYGLNGSLEFRPEDFTADGALRVGVLLWGALVFVNRHLILLVLGAVSSFVGARSGFDGHSLATLYSNPWFLLAGLPALGVLGAALRRSADAGPRCAGCGVAGGGCWCSPPGRISCY